MVPAFGGGDPNNPTAIWIVIILLSVVAILMLGLACDHVFGTHIGDFINGGYSLRPDYVMQPMGKGKSR